MMITMAASPALTRGTMVPLPQARRSPLVAAAPPRPLAPAAPAPPRVSLRGTLGVAGRGAARGPVPVRDAAPGRTVFTMDLSTPDPIPEEGIEAAVALMRSGRLFRYGEDKAGEKPAAAALEEDFAALVGRKYCVALNSGGCALFVALKAVGMQPGDKVLMNAFTLAPVPGAIEHAGGEAVLVDIDDRYVIDLGDLEAKAKASGAKYLMLSYMRGHLPDMDALMLLCDGLGITVVEDCAHTLGAAWRGTPSGGFGAVACYSAQTFKHVNSGEGGLLVTDDDDVAAHAILRSGSYMLYMQHGARPSQEVFDRHRFHVPNCSMRMSALAASLIRPQLALMPERVASWRKSHALVAGALAGAPHVVIPERPAEEFFVPSSLQFSLEGMSAEQMEAFSHECAAHGVFLKWFGNEDAVAFTARHTHWRYLPEGATVPTADRLLSGLCDIRLPLGMSEEECAALAAVIDESVRAVVAR